MGAQKNPAALKWPPIKDMVAAIRDGKITAVSNVEKSFQIIAELNPSYQAVLLTLDERAMQRAKEIDQQISDGKTVGRLAGVPFIAKDNMLVFGGETTAASNMLKGFVAPFQATAVDRLEKEGAICVAKANLDAFAHGASTENSDFFVTKNPYDIERVAGGSSGGSAASVALGFAPFALGSDTGGSIRQPASFCGVVGHKPSYGLVSRSGVVAMASSTDVVGALTTSIEDNALVLDIISGKDDLDGTTIPRDEQPYTVLDTSLKGLRVGVVSEYYGEGVEEGVSKLTKASIEALRSHGAEVSEISMPSLIHGLAVYYIVVPAELSSNLSRHDGQRYQYTAGGTKTLEDSYLESRSKGFGAEAKRRIIIGTHVLSSGYYDAYYKKAQTVRTKIINEFEEAFKQFDVLVGPVAPTPAFKIGENADPIAMYLQDVLSVSASLAGIPALSVPCGDVDGLPVGLQIMARSGADRLLLSVGKHVEELVS